MNLFTPLADAKALGLLEAVNDGRNEKDKYHAHFAFSEKGHIIYIAVNKDKDVIFNVLTDTGGFPKNMSTCWRNWHHIKQDLGI